MPRSGGFTLSVRVDGNALKEHQIDGHHVVTAAPGKVRTCILLPRQIAGYAARHACIPLPRPMLLLSLTSGTPLVLIAQDFEVCLETDSSDGLFLAACFIDGEQCCSRHFLDPGRLTSRGGLRDTVFKHWTKTGGDGSVVRHNYSFAAAAAAGDDSEGPRPCAVDWTHGKIEVCVYRGVKKTLTSDTTSARHTANLSQRASVDEKTMVKNGLSVAAGQGSVTFGQIGQWRAGETYVALDPDEPIVASLELFYRDSFFMALRDCEEESSYCAPKRGGQDTGAAAAGSAAALRATADGLTAAGASGSWLRDKAVHERETREALARKRPKEDGPIDLTEDDD